MENKEITAKGAQTNRESANGAKMNWTRPRLSRIDVAGGTNGLKIPTTTERTNGLRVALGPDPSEQGRDERSKPSGLP